jgi:hypothetical protein
MQLLAASLQLLALSVDIEELRKSKTKLGARS